MEDERRNRKGKTYKAIVGNKKSKEWASKISLAHKGKSWGHHTKETKRKMSLKRMGKTYKELLGEKKVKEWKTKLSQRMQKRWKNPEYRKKMINIAQERTLSKKTKRKISLAHLGKKRLYFKGKNNPNWQNALKIIKCDTCKKEIKRTKSCIKPHNFCCEKCYYKWESIYYKLNNPSSILEIRRKIGEAHKRLWQNEKYKNKKVKELNSAQHKKPNKPELQMIKIIKENKFPFNYVGDGKVYFKGFNPDFLSKNPKHIIEVFGDYWHRRKDVMARDKRRLRAYVFLGYETLIIWEHELKEPQKVAEKIKGFLK
jgi:G:T-mismatch repair DNA endonuclease (very short patch repair protein)